MRGFMCFNMYKKDYSWEQENILILNDEYYNIKWFLFADKICLSNKSFIYKILCLYKNKTTAFSNNNIPTL